MTNRQRMDLKGLRPWQREALLHHLQQQDDRVVGQDKQTHAFDAIVRATGGTAYARILAYLTDRILPADTLATLSAALDETAHYCELQVGQWHNIRERDRRTSNMRRAAIYQANIDALDIWAADLRKVDDAIADLLTPSDNPPSEAHMGLLARRMALSILVAFNDYVLPVVLKTLREGVITLPVQGDNSEALRGQCASCQKNGVYYPTYRGLLARNGHGVGTSASTLVPCERCGYLLCPKTVTSLRCWREHQVKEHDLCQYRGGSKQGRPNAQNYCPNNATDNGYCANHAYLTRKGKLSSLPYTPQQSGLHISRKRK